MYLNLLGNQMFKRCVFRAESERFLQKTNDRDRQVQTICFKNSVNLIKITYSNGDQLFVGNADTKLSVGQPPLEEVK